MTHDSTQLPDALRARLRRDPEAGIEWGGVLRDTTQILASLATVYLVIDRTN